MAIRTYGQHCGLAAAMDLIGQRWSMLVVRELTPGPRRFTDIHEALPGVATDVLAERLRELVAAGVVEHRTTTVPVTAKVYALTESGERLADIGQRLADWGRPLLPEMPKDGTVVKARWALQTMVMGFEGGLVDGEYEFVIDGEVLTAQVVGNDASVHYGPASAEPIVRVTLSSRQFFAAAKGTAWLAQPRRGVQIDGDAAAALAFFDLLPLRVGAAAAAQA